MLKRYAVSAKLLLLALVVRLSVPSVDAQSLDGINGEVATLDVNLVGRGASASSGSFGAAGSVTSSRVVEAHNEVRSEVQASDMEYVDQHGILTGDIKDWLSQCSYKDSLAVHWDDATYPYVNGFKAKLFSPDSISEIINLISQMSAYNVYYKLLMKSDIRYIGCGSATCPGNRLTSDYSLVACLYASRSKLDLNEAPYKSGEPCTECSTGSYWCYDNLCRGDCSDSNMHCECRLDCGEYPIASNCSCLCPSDYDGDDCQHDTDDDSNSDGDSSTTDWTQSGTTLVVSVTLVLIALLCVSLCLILYHKKYRLPKSRRTDSLESRSPEGQTNVYVTPTSTSSSSLDPYKYLTLLPPAYSSISLTTGLDPPPYGFTASPTDAAEEVGDEGSPPPPPPLPSPRSPTTPPPPYQPIDV